MAEILIVEDYPLLASLMARVLRRQGHEVVSVLTVADALSHPEHEFDFAVVDMDLPDGNGVDLAKCLLERRSARQIVFFTATRDETMLLRAAELGVVVDKLAGVELLAQTIRRFERDRINAQGEVPVRCAVDLRVHGCGVSATSGQPPSLVSI